MKKNLIAMILTACALVLVGCEKTPMQKLQANKLYDDMNRAFWAKQHTNKTPLWKEGVAYCRKNEEKPNCWGVMQVFMITNGQTEMPKYGTSGNYLEVPEFKDAR
jgi:hypothetical protein